MRFGSLGARPDDTHRTLERRKPCDRVCTWRGRGLSKEVISRVTSTLNGVTPIITLLMNDLLSPLPLQVRFMLSGFRVQGTGFRGFA